MIFHFSMPTDNPERVARVIAELWKGEAFPFYPHRNESWVAFSGDDYGTSVECYKWGILLAPSEEEHPTGFILHRTAENPVRASATHAAIATPLNQEEVMAIGAREGWKCRYAQRGRFGVIELWVENAILLEMMTPELQKQYIEATRLAVWREMTAAMKAREASAAE